MSARGDIARYMRKIIADYDSIRGKQKNKGRFLFWDVVAISALDDKQQKAFELQIVEKQKKSEVPLDVQYLVFHDPPGDKIGCGGSTLYVMDQLAEIYGSLLHGMRVLFIPAGGYSQRLPSWSVLGKLFSPVPLRANPIYQMIDLIFAVYLPFLKSMPPGVFLASSDAIISYCLESTDKWTFHNRGFTALAHPSPISVGTEHGVYVLQNNDDGPEHTFMSYCLEVLQKPSEDVMREKGAIIDGVSPGVVGRSEMVYSDSVFFFDMNIALKFARFYRESKPLNVELNSYSDFLQPVGLLSDPSYIESDDDELRSVRMQLFGMLNGTPLSVLVLKRSAFHHFGSMSEYLENYSYGSDFTKHFPFKSFVSSCFTSGSRYLSDAKGTVMHSSIHHTTIVPLSSVVEYCDFTVPINVGAKTILSNCKLHFECLPPEVPVPQLPLEIPPNILIHTIAVDIGFITVCFGVNDQIKECCVPKEAENLTFLNMKFSVLMDKMKGYIWFDPNCELISLWDARIFAVCPSMDESFVHTYNLIQALHDCESAWVSDPENTTCLSMKDIILMKHVETTIDFHKDLLLSIRLA